MILWPAAPPYEPDHGARAMAARSCDFTSCTPFPARLNAASDRWPSGRRRAPGKCVGGRPSRGFESLPVRHLPPRKRSPGPATAGFSRCFRRLCGKGFALVPAPYDPKAVSEGRYSLDLSTVRIRCRACNSQKKCNKIYGRPEHFDASRAIETGPASNNTVAHWPSHQLYSAGSATAACFVMMSCTSPGLNATSHPQRPKPPAVFIAFTHSFSASRLALF